MKTLSQLSTGTRHQQQHQQAQVAGPRRYKKSEWQSTSFYIYDKAAQLTPQCPKVKNLS